MKLPDIAVEARYVEADEKIYKGNPFIEALPPKSSQSQLKKYLTHEICDDFLPDEDDDITRFHKIVSLIDGWFQPLANHFQLEQKLSLMIRKGYVGRNIKTGDLNRQLRKGYEQIKSGGEMVQFGDIQSTAQSDLFIGGSGLGKTSVLNFLLASYPQVIFHPLYNHVQITYVKVDCPHDGTLKGLCFHILVEIDKAMGTNYQNTIRQRWGVERLVSYIAQIITKYSVGILVIDEIQNLLVAKVGGKDKMLSFFGRLVNVINIPVLMVGTPKAKQVMMDNFMYARRCTGAGTIEWRPLKTSTQKRRNSAPSAPRSEWQAFTDRLWKKQFLHNATAELPDDVLETWFDCSQGIVDIVIKLFVFTQIRAVVTKQERITSRIMRKVYEDEFAPIHPMIDALRSKDPDRIAKYSDLHMDQTLNFLTEKEKLFKELEEKSRKKVKKFNGNKLTIELFHFLLDLDVDEVEANTIAKMVTTDHPDKTQIKDLVKIALVYQAEDKHVKSQKKVSTIKPLPQSRWGSLDGQDLRFIHATKIGDIYDDLADRELIYKLA